MKLTEKQAQVLVQTLADTLRFGDHATGFSYDYKTRESFYTQIINQQSNVLKDVEP